MNWFAIVVIVWMICTTLCHIFGNKPGKSPLGFGLDIKLHPRKSQWDKQ